MAKVQAIWGIDIGQCSLKALRCVEGENGEVVADAFDFVEYPKILSQPDVEPEELVKEALEQFLSRNDVKGDKVAISVTGQAGLSRFFKPPPVDSKTLPEIVRYEAKQQIPFPLEDVIWDFQRIGGTEVDGLIVDAEVGLFAMKREAVYRALQPFKEAGVEVDHIQLAPLAGFNFLINDILPEVSEEDEIDPENPPESLVLLAIGTETTDLVITNGIHLWMRNIPIGGNHFTKQLSRELKLTFTKAEHLKRNTRQAEDPKTLFQAMRPVFNDLVTEIQRSISYFQGINRNASIGRMMMVGNAGKLPGLRQYLIKNLETEIVKFEKFPTLKGEVVVSQKTFKENILTFSVAYGLCLQGLNQARIRTNLLPQEFLTERLIRAKKPWALASIGAVLVGLTCSLLFSANSWWKVNEDRVVDGKSWKDGISAVNNVSNISQKYIDRDAALTKRHRQFKAVNRELVQSKDEFKLAPEIYSAIFQAFPEGPNAKRGEPFDPLKTDHSDREVIIIEDWEWKQVEKLEDWFNTNQDDFEESISELNPFEEPQDDPAADPSDTGPGKTANNNAKDQKSQPDTGPKGPGRVLVLNCYHDHNDFGKYPDASDREKSYVRKTLIRNLLFGPVQFQGESTSFPALGLNYPTIVTLPGNIDQATEVEIRNPYYTKFLEEDSFPDKDESEWTAEEKRKYSPEWTVRRYNFSLQIVWQPIPETAREEARKVLAEAKKAEEEKLQQQSGGGNKPADGKTSNPGKKGKQTGNNKQGTTKTNPKQDESPQKGVPASGTQPNKKKGVDPANSAPNAPEKDANKQPPKKQPPAALPGGGQ